MRISHYHVAVIGGGPAGAVTALELARSGRRVVLVDRPSIVAVPLGEALPPAARPVLESLGLMDRFVRDDHAVSYGNRSLWGSTVPTETDFIFHPTGTGWRLDRARFDHMLIEAARDAGAHVVTGRYGGASGGAGEWRLTIEKLGETRADFVVDASGRAAVFARQQGARRLRVDRLIGLAVLLESKERDDDSKTLVEAAPDGWWYSARLPVYGAPQHSAPLPGTPASVATGGGRRVMVFLSDRDLLDLAWMRTASGWRGSVDDTVQMHALMRRGHYRVRGRVHGVPAETARLSPCRGPGWLAVGDAALSFDPLASQGILTALQSAQMAATSVANGGYHYAAYLDDVHARHIAGCLTHYSLERRWSARPFWRRRMATS